MARQAAPALAYFRTSSAANVGEGKDSVPRQREAVQRYAKAAGFSIEAEYRDEAVSGEDHIEDRPGFAALLDAIEGNGVRTVLVEDGSRFARSMLASELGILLLRERGVRLVTASGDDLTDDSDEMREAMRQIATTFAQVEKKRLVKKLRHARDQKSAELGRRVEGRKPSIPDDTRALAKKLRRKNPHTGKRRSYRQIAADLAAQGHVGENGQTFGAESVKRMVEG